ncbi:MAG: hypothetical protein IIZ06_07155 [Kiritimatiellae bacterium]|nr:hypothetical protein [Kiritimatiellia bacterium]
MNMATVFLNRAAVLSAAISSAAVATASVEPEFTWGGRAPHPAVVNPLLGEDPAAVISLRGEWEFVSFDTAKPYRNGCWPKMFKETTKFWNDRRKIMVPGCWEAQGVGEPGDSVSWDATWDNNIKPLRHRLMGECWYRRSVEIPSSWAGKRIWIKFGGVNNAGWVWVNERQVAYIDNYCATEKYEITDVVKPGETAKVVVEVTNLRPSRKGLTGVHHRWGGIYRDVELEATPQTFIDDAWVRGDFDAKCAEAHVEIGGAVSSEPPYQLRVTIDGTTVSQAFQSTARCTPHGARFAARCARGISRCAPSQTSQTLKLPLRNFRPWSPEHPNLYTAKVELVAGDGTVLQTRRERFGVRKIEVRGREFYLNGKPFFIRGFGDDAAYPITGITPPDVDEHRRHLAKAREAGFNYVRLHTHCEVPEYFEAADEAGVMIQAELPYYSDLPTEGFEFDPKRDVTELWRNFRRHPSFTTYSMGNEGSFGDELDVRMHKYVKAMDPDRLKINQDTNLPEISAPDRSDYSGGPIRPWPRGTFKSDRPAVCHEYLNLSVKTDSRSEGRYTGVWMPPATRKARGEWLARFGLGLDWGDRLQDAQHVLQGVWQKQGIESARADPHCGGYIYWTIVDVIVWNAKTDSFASQGLFDPFWEEKRSGTTAAQFAVYNSPSCVLADFAPTSAVLTEGDMLSADISFAHYGDEPIAEATVGWAFVAEGGETLSSGAAAAGRQELGGVRKVAAFSVVAPKVAKPTKVEFAATVTGGMAPVANSWTFWIFPKGPTHAQVVAGAASCGVTVAAKDSPEAKAALAKGENLITVDGADGKPNIRLGWWWMGSQVGTAIREHPAFGDFPCEGAMTPLWFRLVKDTGLALPAKGIAPQDMIIVGEGGEACFVYMAERRIGNSRVLECHGLDLDSDIPEGNALLARLVDYLKSGKSSR